MPMAILKSHQKLFQLFILIVFCFQWSQNSRVLQDFGDDKFVRGIIQYGDPPGSSLAIALREEVIFEKYFEANGTSSFATTGTIKLHGSTVGEYRLLEFKAINESAVLVCTSDGCSVCYNTNMDSACSPLKLPYSSFTEIAVSIVDEKIIMRSVFAASKYSSIDIFEPIGLYQYQRIKSEDGGFSKRIMSEQKVVLAFSTPDYTFFVGSAKRLDIALRNSDDGINYNENTVRKNTEIRITRICNNDRTSILDSRIDLVLSCDNINYNFALDIAIENVATVAVYNPDNNKLLVGMKNGKKNNTICEYNFEEIQQRFNDIWDGCQSISYGKDTEHSCPNNEYKDLPPECFVFTWRKNEQYPYCEAYNNMPKQEALRNCFLHETNSTHKAFGLLEDFRPFIGKAVYKGSGQQTFVALKESKDPKIMFALDEHNKLQRIELDPDKFDNSLMKRSARRGSHMLVFLKSNDVVLFADPQTLTTMNYVHVTCKELYETCHNISWDDPLNCGFCVNSDGSGLVIPKSKLLCGTGNIMENVCPPVIENIHKNSGGVVIIEGQNLRKLDNPYVTICDQPCKINAREDTYIKCKANPFKEKGCNITVIGALNEQYPRFALQKLIDNEDGAASTPASDKKSWWDNKVVRYVGYGVSAVLMLSIIAMGYCYINKRYRRRKLGNGGKQPSENISTPLDSLTQSYAPVPDIPLEIRNKGTINMTQIKLGQRIGEGVSANVYHGLFAKDLANPSDVIEVAVKMAKSNTEQSDQDIEKEIEMMKDCKHENVIRFIGWAYTSEQYYIITEYLRGGNLRSYLLDGNNRPTIGKCFSFINQILEGMLYLSRKHIIHRDLATRNCLLNVDYSFIKISDFGLSRKTDMNYEYIALQNPRLPYRWLPLESLSKNYFTSKTDVWSFAVVIWELFKRGATPYEGLDIRGVKNFLTAGNRLPRPEYCPDDLYTLMLLCWDTDADKRPTFETLKISINRILENYARENPEVVNSEYQRDEEGYEQPMPAGRSTISEDQTSV